jgi:hypothetical protein
LEIHLPARRRDIAVDIVDRMDKSIPFPDNSFDSVHVGLVLWLG